MNLIKLTKKFKKLSTDLNFNSWMDQSVDMIANSYPNVSLKSFSEFDSWLQSIIPKLIHKYMLSTKSMKVCSTISPDFSKIAAAYGFPVGVMKIPGHHFNIAFTSDGLYKVDLSAIQFTCKNEITDRANRTEVIDNFKKLLNNPFAAVEVSKLPNQIVDFEFPGVSLVQSYDPVISFEKYDPELSEEDNYWFNKLRNE